MSADDRELAGDCWLAIGLLDHGAETPEWLAASAQALRPAELPA